MMSSDILRRAAALLTSNGWTQGRSIDEDGRMCALAALMTAADMDMAALDGATTALMIQIRASHRQTWWQRLLGYNGAPVTIGEWNDSPRRTAAEVISTMQAAAMGYDWGAR